MNQVAPTLLAVIRTQAPTLVIGCVMSSLTSAMRYLALLCALMSPSLHAEFRTAAPQQSFGESAPFGGFLAAYCFEIRPKLPHNQSGSYEPKLIGVHLILIEDRQMKLAKSLKLAAATGAFLISSMSFAQSINIGNNDLAIKGYDPVAYFTQNKAVEGSAKFTATHDGAIYRFNSASNRDQFKANADKYAPQFGGFCAMGVALNKKLDVDPQAFYIKEDKLYLNLNKDVQKKWLTDIPGHLKTANRVWRGIEDLSVAQANAED